MAAFLGCPATELFPLPNVTAGLNAVLASLEPSLSKGIVACTSLTYGSTKKMLAALAQRTGCTFVIIPVTLPVSSDGSSVGNDVCEALQRLAPSQSPVRLIVLDTVTSNTAIRLPVGSISRRIRELDGCKDGTGEAEGRGLFIVADAAHSFMTETAPFLPTTAASTAAACPSGAEDLRGIDAWLTNLHKWGCAPRGVGFMWVSPRLQKLLRPAIISHGFDVPVPAPFALDSSPPAHTARSSGKRLLSGFSWDGCRDYAALLTTASTLRLWSKAAPKAISYSSSLVSSAVAMLRQEWRPSEAAAPRYLIRNDKEEEEGGGGARVPTMTLVPLPDRVAGGIDTTKECSDSQAFALQNALYELGIEVPVKCIGGRLYLRLSCHVHNDEDDYAHLAAAIKKI